MKNRVAAIDIGSSKVACLVAERGEEGTLGILAATSAPCRGLRKGVVVDLDEAASSLTEAVRDINESLGEPLTSAVVAVGGSHVEAQRTRGMIPIFPSTRPITRDDVLQVVNHSRQHVWPPDREEIQALPGSFVIDGQRGIQKPVGMSGARLEVSTLVVSGQKAHLANVERAFEMAGLDIEQLVLKSMASALGVLTTEQLETGVAVVDIGAGTTDLVVFESGSPCYAASIPVGSTMVTADLSKLLKTSPEEADRLKERFGDALARQVDDEETVGVMQLGQIHERPLQKRVLCEIIESRHREVATFVSQHIARSGRSADLAGGVVLTGGGALQSGLATLYQDVLGRNDVRIGTPGFRGKAAQSLDSPMWATAVGLTRYALNSQEDVLGTISENGSLTGRIKTLWSMISGRA